MSNTFQTIDKTLLITAGAYSASDVVGGLLTFTPNHLIEGGLLLDRVLLIDDDNEKANMKLYLFDDVPTTIADNGAFATALLVADLKKMVCAPIAIDTYVTINGNAYAEADGSNDVFGIPSGKLYGYLVCDGTPTYTATSDLFLRTFWLKK